MPALACGPRRGRCGRSPRRRGAAGRRQRLAPAHDGAENYPAWLDGHRRRPSTASTSRATSCTTTRPGARFAEALAARARAGVRVRLHLRLAGRARRDLARVLVSACGDAGVEVRAFNPPRCRRAVRVAVARPPQDARRSTASVAFVSGLCVGDAWVGDPGKGVEPWRDTGVEIRGPAVADVDAAFAEIWAHDRARRCPPRSGRRASRCRRPATSRCG